mmetsp:Transcript_3794/g.7885  ORF Transcript_3794/g.7885 Transcript_3794/m.7885 type:complete len:108 (-) Transcript_3794:1060-1383(-)
MKGACVDFCAVLCLPKSRARTAGGSLPSVPGWRIQKYDWKELIDVIEKSNNWLERFPRRIGQNLKMPRSLQRKIGRHEQFVHVDVQKSEYFINYVQGRSWLKILRFQ